MLRMCSSERRSWRPPLCAEHSCRALPCRTVPSRASPGRAVPVQALPAERCHAVPRHTGTGPTRPDPTEPCLPSRVLPSLCARSHACPARPCPTWQRRAMPNPACRVFKQAASTCHAVRGHALPSAPDRACLTLPTMPRRAEPRVGGPAQPRRPCYLRRRLPSFFGSPLSLRSITSMTGRNSTSIRYFAARAENSRRA